MSTCKNYILLGVLALFPCLIVLGVSDILARGGGGGGDGGHGGGRGDGGGHHGNEGDHHDDDHHDHDDDHDNYYNGGGYYSGDYPDYAPGYYPGGIFIYSETQEDNDD